MNWFKASISLFLVLGIIGSAHAREACTYTVSKYNHEYGGSLRGDLLLYIKGYKRVKENGKFEIDYDCTNYRGFYECDVNLYGVIGPDKTEKIASGRGYNWNFIFNKPAARRAILRLPFCRNALKVLK